MQMPQMNRRNFVRAAAGSAIVSQFAIPNALQAATPTATTVRLPIPPRLQWDELDG